MSKQLTLFDVETKRIPWNKGRKIAPAFVCVRCGFCDRIISLTRTQYYYHVFHGYSTWRCNEKECRSKQRSITASLINKKNWANNEYREQMKTKMSESAKKRFEDPVYRAQKIEQITSNESRMKSNASHRTYQYRQKHLRNQAGKGNSSIELICNNCGKVFSRFSHYIKKDIRGNPHRKYWYCSLLCWYSFNSGANNCNYGLKFIGRGKGRKRPELIGSNNPMFRRNGKRVPNIKYRGYRHDLGHNVRSSWEANYCRILRFLGIQYKYEPPAIPLCNTTYTPDIKIGDLFIEIKGYLNIGWCVKLSELKRINPRFRLVVINENHYRALENHYSDIIPLWESIRYRDRKRKVAIMA